MSTFRATSILLVEDNLADVRLTVELLREAKLANRVRVVADGDDAIAQLCGTAEEVELPDLVLLDLQLPGANGREVLRRIRGDARVRALPVFILTASATHMEMLRDEGLDADGYLVKPIDLTEFMNAVIRRDHFWLQLVSTPQS